MLLCIRQDMEFNVEFFYFFGVRSSVTTCRFLKEKKGRSNAASTRMACLIITELMNQEWLTNAYMLVNAPNENCSKAS